MKLYEAFFVAITGAGKYKNDIGKDLPHLDGMNVPEMIRHMNQQGWLHTGETILDLGNWIPNPCRTYIFQREKE